MAAGGKLHPSTSMTFLLQNDGFFSPSGFLGPWPATSTMERPLFRPIEWDEIGAGEEEADEYCGLHQAGEKKRRLTAEQAQFLEQSFEFENKLEPERKLQLAKALGLKPRQVAIWFQNRRARWKTKQLEKEFEALKSSYQALKIDHDSLLKEKDELEAQVHALTKRLLLREKDQRKNKRKKYMESFELNKLPKLPNLDNAAARGFEAKKPLCKQEDMMSSANSTTILDPEIDGGGYSSMLVELTGGSSAAFEIDNSDRSQIDDAPEFLGIEDNDSEQGFWLWS